MVNPPELKSFEATLSPWSSAGSLIPESKISSILSREGLDGYFSSFASEKVSAISSSQEMDLDAALKKSYDKMSNSKKVGAIVSSHEFDLSATSGKSDIENVKMFGSIKRAYEDVARTVRRV